jgi:hypothetical protein
VGNSVIVLDKTNGDVYTLDGKKVIKINLIKKYLKDLE